MTMGKDQIFTPKSPPSSTSPHLSMHKNSQPISKPKPKIRIIHIFAPEIIKTDASNFRELVQRLTGKPEEDQTPKRPGLITASSKKMEIMAMRAGFHAAGCRERIKDEEEEEIWNGANSGGGFLGGFSEFEYGFMQEINQFPFLEGTTQMDVYGESQLA